MPNDRVGLLMMRTTPPDPGPILDRARELLRHASVPTPAPPPIVPPVDGNYAERLETAIGIGLALGHVPYVLGSPCGRSADCTSSFDCSSFVRYIFTHAGFHMPYAQTGRFADELTHVSPGDVQRGDIFVWAPPGGGSYSAVDAHTGVWLGDGHTLDCRFPTGTGVFLPLNRQHVIVRASL